MLRIIDHFKTEHAIFYTVELAPDRFVDVKVFRDHQEFGDLLYIMQNHDGTTVYDDNGDTHPRFPYSVQEVILLCKNES